MGSPVRDLALHPPGPRAGCGGFVLVHEWNLAAITAGRKIFGFW